MTQVYRFSARFPRSIHLHLSSYFFLQKALPNLKTSSTGRAGYRVQSPQSFPTDGRAGPAARAILPLGDTVTYLVQSSCRGLACGIMTTVSAQQRQYSQWMRLQPSAGLGDELLVIFLYAVLTPRRYSCREHVISSDEDKGEWREPHTMQIMTFSHKNL